MCYNVLCCFFFEDLSEIHDDQQLTVDIAEEVDDVLTARTVDGLDNKEEGMSHSMENCPHTYTT